MDINNIYKNKEKLMGSNVLINGWIKNHRKQKNMGFIDFHDGTCFKSIQVVYEDNIIDFEAIQSLKIGSSINVSGIIVESMGGNQDLEIKADRIVLLGSSTDEYPIQPKRHTREFLREVAYLRPRTNLFQAIFRLRSKTAFIIHKFFQEKDFIYLNSPLITSVDCEGTGEMFKLTTFDLNNMPRLKDGSIDFTKDLFSMPVSLTGTGQLHGEAFALAMNKIYTFGPTFRTENSNTKIHANEFWMIEPEIAFISLNELMNLEEELLKYVVSNVLKECSDEIEFLNNFVDNNLKNKLTSVLEKPFVRISHKEAIDILINSKVEFENCPGYEEDLAKEHERYLTEKHFNSPVFVTDWPKDIKAFYMRINDDNKTVSAVDLIVPFAGELMGGSQREERYDVLIKRMEELSIPKEDLEWYLNLRKFGGCVHSGFGLGFERLLIYLTGVDNIRDVIPFPRTPKSCDY